MAYTAQLGSGYMISVTKIFRFEAAHAIFGYQGKCSGIHGHSYELHVTVRAASQSFLEPAGFIIDFKELKTIVVKTIIDNMDHMVLLSKKYIEQHKEAKAMNNIIVLESEPSVENLLLFIIEQLAENFPPHIQLTGLKLFETKDSYAQWKSEYTSNKYFSSL
jgi:6-pyruvoyltetrahydropterin/6-carboxytetrahydropterin synthase